MSGKFLSIEECGKIINYPGFNHLLTVLKADYAEDELIYYDNADWVAAGQNCQDPEHIKAVCLSVFVNEVLSGNDSDIPEES